MRNFLLKKILLVFLLFIIALGIFSPAYIQAQGSIPPPTPVIQAAQQAEQTTPQNTSVNVGAANTTNVANPTGTPVNMECSWVLYDCLDNFVVWAAGITLQLSALFIAIAGIALNFVIDYTVVQSATTIGGIEAVNIVWKVFRDLSNMMFIFILLYIAIGTILNLGGVDMKKTLRNVILVAILINFSLFFTKVIIDASNVLTLGFYSKIKTSSSIQVSSTEASSIDIGLSGAFMQRMGLSSIWDPEGARNMLLGIQPSTGQPTSSIIQVMIMGVLGSIFLIVGGIVFAAGALMFINRYLVFIFLLMLSPLAFASMALPNDKHSKVFWSKLIDMCLFAPVFMALIWAALTAFVSFTGGEGTPSFAKVISGLSSGDGLKNIGQLIMNFAILIGMFVISLYAAKEFGAKGAEWGMDRVQGFKKGVQNTLRSTGGFAGRAAVRASRVGKLDEAWKKSGFGGYYGDQFRKMTTGKVMGAKFGSKASVADVKKDAKKYAKEFTEETEKELEKDFNKPANIKGLRTARMAELTNLIATAQERNDDVEATRLTRMREEMRQRRDEELEATSEEKRMWLRPLQKEKAEELTQKSWTRWYIPESRKAAAKKLRENAARGGIRSTDDLLSSLLSNTGGGGGGGGTPPATGGGGGH